MRKLIIPLILVTLGLLACSRTGNAPPAIDDRPSQTLPAGLSRVADPSLVCMVNDQFMGRTQIPTVVEGRTYYGCCPACKDKLEKLPESRTAHDPVTGEPVDKASAVMLQDATGKVLYFASEDTVRRYQG